jgi:hypothetical protein
MELSDSGFAGLIFSGPDGVDVTMIEVTCETCEAEFQVKDDAKNPVKCKVCQSACDVPELRKRDKSQAKKGAKCPGCQKRLAPGVKFCAACGTSTVDADAAQVALFDVDRQMPERIGLLRLKMWFMRWF